MSVLMFAATPESVKEFETVGGQSFCMSASREGSLIHATVGSFGGVGRRPRNLSGFAAKAASRVRARSSRISVAVP
jgi:hypothetical protein